MCLALKISEVKLISVSRNVTKAIKSHPHGVYRKCVNAFRNVNVGMLGMSLPEIKLINLPKSVS